MKIARLLTVLLLALSGCSISFDSPQSLQLDISLLSGGWSSASGGTDQNARFLSPNSDKVFVEVRLESETGPIFYTTTLPITNSKSGGGFSSKASGSIPGLKPGDKFVISAETRENDKGVEVPVSRGSSGVLTAGFGTTASITLLPLGSNPHLYGLDLGSEEYDLAARETGFFAISTTTPSISVSWNSDSYDALYQVRDSSGNRIATTSTYESPMTTVTFQVASTDPYYVLLYNNTDSGFTFDMNVEEAAETIVAISADGKAYRSGDGIHWNAGVSTPLNIANDIAYGDGLFVAVGQILDSYGIVTSSDGLNWSIASVGSAITASRQILHIEVNTSGYFVANGNGGGTSNEAVISPNGLSWAYYSLPNGSPGTGPAWNGSAWYIMNSNGTAVHTSTSGSTWSLVSGSPGSTHQVGALFGAGSVLVAGGDDGSLKAASTSTDGSTWSGYNILGGSGSTTVKDFAYNPSLNVLLLVGTGTANQVWYSTNSGSTWNLSTITATADLYAAARTSGGFVVGGANGKTYFDSDGADFEAKYSATLGTAAIKGIASSYSP